MKEIFDYCQTVPRAEIDFVDAAFQMNMDLFYLVSVAAQLLGEPAWPWAWFILWVANS
ncbi:MAG: hypothetical protein Q4D97_01490 [Eubacteriales bacterium]|nr:hypothetical protein [Eubacteriales bacterium]